MDAPTTPAERRRSGRADHRVLRSPWFWYLVGGIAFLAASMPTYPVEGEPVIGLTALVALILSIRRYRPAVRAPWLLLVVGQVIVDGALIAWSVYYVITGQGAPYPSPIDAVYLCSYVAFACGLAMFVRRRPGHSPWEGVLDAALVTAGVAGALWVLVYRPYLSVSGISKWTEMTALAYPSMDLLLASIVVWLVFTVGVRTPAFLLLVGSITMLLTADILQAILASHGVNANGDVITLAGWDLSLVLFGTAALHPSMARTADPVRAGAAVASKGRVGVYLVVALAGPTFALVQSAVDLSFAHFLDNLVPLALAVVVAVLLVFRLTQLAHLANGRAMELDRQAAALERSQRDLRRAHQRMATMFEVAPTGMAHLGPDGTILAVNAALARFLGRTEQELVGQPAQALVDPDDLPRLLDAIRDVVHDVRQRNAELRSVDARGDHKWADWVVSRMHVPADGHVTAIAVIADRTDARRLEVELRHAQKLEAIGRLAAGVAHELNTPIQFIGDNVDFLGNAATQLVLTLRQSEDSAANRARPVDSAELDYLAGEIPEAVRQTKDGVTRVGTIVAALKSFAHRDAPTHQPADVNRALTDTLTVARAELRGVGTVRTELEPLPPVVCSIGDLNQVFLNLLINAADAIADDPDATKAHEIAVCSRLDGDDVVIEVSDTGVGIPGGLLDKIFEPFFTTKAVGRGSGQGLALVRTIVVDGHHGSIHVDSTPGIGTTFTVRIPLTSRPAASPAPITTAGSATTRSHS